jgi:hypothetical protein
MHHREDDDDLEDQEPSATEEPTGLCPFCDEAALSLDRERGEVEFLAPCDHLVYAYWKDGRGDDWWEHPLLINGGIDNRAMFLAVVREGRLPAGIPPVTVSSFRLRPDSTNGAAGAGKRRWVLGGFHALDPMRFIDAAQEAFPLTEDSEDQEEEIDLG